MPFGTRKYRLQRLPSPTTAVNHFTFAVARLYTTADGFPRNRPWPDLRQGQAFVTDGPRFSDSGSVRLISADKVVGTLTNENIDKAYKRISRPCKVFNDE